MKTMELTLFCFTVIITHNSSTISEVKEYFLKNFEEEIDDDLAASLLENSIYYQPLKNLMCEIKLDVECMFNVHFPLIGNLSTDPGYVLPPMIKSKDDLYGYGPCDLFF